MRKILYPCLLILLYSFPASAQINAVTDDGKEVILNTNGTWKYKADVVTPGYETRLDTPTFQKSKDATFLLKGKKVKYGVWLDPKKWKFKAGEDDVKEYMLTLRGEDAYVMIIPERISLAVNNLVDIAIENSKKVAPDAHIVREETRKINGIIVKQAEIRGTVNGMNVVYMGYYYGGQAGTIQVVAYTSDNLYNRYKKEMQDLLNGFVILDN